LSFVSTRKRIYQPVKIKVLLESDTNKASVRQIADSFLQKDESQLEYYIQITRAIPGRVLSRHDIVHYESGNYSLNVKGLSPSERSDLIHLCEKKGYRLLQHLQQQQQLQQQQELIVLLYQVKY
jgi:hypothetical protein